MNSGFFVVLLFFLYLYYDNYKKQNYFRLVRKKIINRRNGVFEKEKIDMNALIKSLVGERCIIYLMQSAVSGVIELNDEDNQWINVRKENDTCEVINIDYIIRIAQYPQKKKKKKLSIEE